MDESDLHAVLEEEGFGEVARLLGGLEEALESLRPMDPLEAMRGLFVGIYTPDCRHPEFLRFAAETFFLTQEGLASASWACHELFEAAEVPVQRGSYERVEAVFAARLEAWRQVATLLWWLSVQEGLFSPQLRQVGIEPEALFAAHEAQLRGETLTEEQSQLLRDWGTRLAREHAQALAPWLLTSEIPGLFGAPKRRLRAVYMLQCLGPHAAPAVPALLAQLDDSDTDFVAEVVLALGRIGSPAKAAVPVFKRLRRNPQLAWIARHSLDLLRKGRCECCGSTR